MLLWEQFKSDGSVLHSLLIFISKQPETNPRASFVLSMDTDGQG